MRGTHARLTPTRFDHIFAPIVHQPHPPQQPRLRTHDCRRHLLQFSALRSAPRKANVRHESQQHTVAGALRTFLQPPTASHHHTHKSKIRTHASHAATFQPQRWESSRRALPILCSQSSFPHRSAQAKTSASGSSRSEHVVLQRTWWLNGVTCLGEPFPNPSVRTLCKSWMSLMGVG